MKVVVSGGTGVIGRSAVRALVAAECVVDVLSRSPGNQSLIESMGARPCPGDVFDMASLVPLYEDADVVVNLATHVPVGYAAMLPSAWRRHDALRTTGVGNVVRAAREAGVRRLIQESVSLLYAGQGDEWITEQSPIEITPATEPAAVGESKVDEYSCDSRIGVVLRFGQIIGDDDLTRFWLRAAANGRPVGIGRPDAWTHLIHTDDLGPAVVAALHAPKGSYNVGAEPIRKAELVAGYARAVGAEHGSFMGPILRRLAGARMEPLTRSLRISSDHFAAQTGWRARRSVFEPSWFDAAEVVGVGS